MTTYKVINKQTGLVEFEGSYDDCGAYRYKLMEEEAAVMSRPEDYYLIKLCK